MKKNWRLFLKYFVPNERNEYKPYFLRSESTASIFLVVLLIELVFVVQFFVFSPRGNFLGAVLSGSLISLTNEERGLQGIAKLSSNTLLTKAAEAKAEDMVARGYFSHIGPEGEEPWVWLDRAGYKYSYAGENLAVNFNESADVASAWKRSPTHWQNIMNGDFKEIGIGVAQGIHKGKEATFVVQFFGTAIEPDLPKTLKAENTQKFSEVGQKEVSGEVKGTSVIVSEPSFLTTVVSSPRLYTNWILTVLLGLVLVGFTLAVLVKLRVQHGSVIRNGILLVVVIAGAILLNNFYFKIPVELPSENSYISNKVLP